MKTEEVIVVLLCRTLQVVSKPISLSLPFCPIVSLPNCLSATMYLCSVSLHLYPSASLSLYICLSIAQPLCHCGSLGCSPCVSLYLSYQLAFPPFHISWLSSINLFEPILCFYSFFILSVLIYTIIISLNIFVSLYPPMSVCCNILYTHNLPLSYIASFLSATFYVYFWVSLSPCYKGYKSRSRVICFSFSLLVLWLQRPLLIKLLLCQSTPN